MSIQSGGIETKRASAPTGSHRLLSIDIGRTVSLFAMVIFHLAWDLTMFGFLPADAMQAVAWRVFAWTIAGSFLFLSGVSLWLAHGDAIRWRAFLRRLGILLLAAIAVSAATRLAMPHAWVRFGILHSIAVSTTISLLFLRVPVAVLAVASVAALLAGRIDVAAFDGPAWLWTGLGASRPRMLDYEPIFPWLGVCLAGLLFARLFAGRWRAPARPPSTIQSVLAWPGRNSLAFYLLHQPILFGAVWLASSVSQ
ncbi:heparan-alpha-glucosaminide N-acetyltransferase [Sedimentitalea todarodis]|uniref:Heparan-alpha-glucosaminide N-acetyltransferase n=1 Tax=Sedimentitalea todarodis TaxID=1631240 RepID=A0ABU3VIF3_9RHOB|nr:heparan-alpha-glucosaminide N-acetyltransferase [Sedimentitalea todarodis]MDU9005474.1 heparan-alpha-glucosaminide N-acetyltransferase [Sedimentitalea todarodis]